MATGIKFLGCCIAIAACYISGIDPGAWYIASFFTFFEDESGIVINYVGKELKDGISDKKVSK